MSNRLYTVSTLGIDLLSILGFITFPKEVFYYTQFIKNVRDSVVRMTPVFSLFGENSVMGFPPGTTETVSRVTSRCLDCLYLLSSTFKSLFFGIVYGVCHLCKVVDKNLFSTCSVSVLSLSWYTFEVNVLTLLNIFL